LDGVTESDSDPPQDAFLKPDPTASRAGRWIAAGRLSLPVAKKKPRPELRDAAGASALTLCRMGPASFSLPGGGLSKRERRTARRGVTARMLPSAVRN
jgi:hypothetical protein